MPDEFDEQWYLDRYPDVAAAVAEGKISSAYVHYQIHGLAENRQPSAAADSRDSRPRTHYQSFPGEEGDSQSEMKFHCLNYSSFDGKSVLDVGCNEGFFCFKAAAGGATKVVGIDQN